MEEQQVTPEIVEAPIVEQAVNTENAEPNIEAVETKTEKTFTQAELDSIITKRVERERETTAKKVAQEARDAYIAEQGHSWNGQPIKTEAEYKQALKDQSLMEKYRAQDLPDEVINELVESKKFREQYESEKQTVAQKAQQEAEFTAFIETFPDTDPKDIPQTVWDDVSKGKSLVDAFTRHENQTLKQQLAEVAKAKEIETINATNAASSTGSLTGNGETITGHYTLEQVQKMSQSEVDRNYKAIIESQKKWYK